jgi:alpha-tubulin suppressor-like RCC1 family protein
MPALLQSEWRDSLGLGTAVAGISPHSLFIDANGALMVCGFEREPGTLGLPQSQDDSENEADSEDEEDEFRTVLEPTFVPSMAGIRIRQVVAGCDCSLAVSEAGRMYMWGRGGDGRLASDTENREEPTMIQELSHHRVRQVAIAIDLCAAVTEEGLLFTWATASTAEDYDGNREAEQGPPRLGLGLDDTNGQWPPQCVTALKDERVGSVAIGRGFTLVTTEAGAVFSFGDGNNGSLGHDDYDTHILPKRVEALDGVYVAAVAAGYHQSLALTACGRVFWWERRIQSATQHEWQPLPQQVHSAFGGGRVRSIAATFFTAYAVTDAGELFAWGCDSHAQASGLPLGNGNCQVQLSPWPVAGLHGITVVGVSAGQLHTLVLAADGSVYGFGLGYSLGIGSGVGGEWYPEDLEGDAADEVEGQMILAETGDRIQLTPKKIPGLVCSVPRTLQNS